MYPGKVERKLYVTEPRFKAKEWSQGHAWIKMDLAFGSAKPYGSSRSIVRRIGSNLPFGPCPRIHFQLYPYSEDAGVLITTRRRNGLVAGLADIACIDRENEDYSDAPRSDVSQGLMFRAQRHHFHRRPLTRQRSLPSMPEGAPDPQSATVANDEAFQKISLLEAELAQLRAQIAQIVLTQERTAQSAAITGVPPHPPPSGSLPPPPPPPPPLPPPGLQRTFSAIDLIKERKGKKTDQATVLDSRPAEIPNMLEVLKDLNKVRLRSVNSQPAKEVAKVRSKEPVDAAALIAEALRRKFAHRHRLNSEQDAVEDFKLPIKEVKPQSETPLFGQHMLKATGKRTCL
ncbi:mitochondrial fission regulator 1 isoform X1 [Oryzias latipes]|nr:mitochondrial fission regulator 1 isoform X1 [Oryzias latipes]